jgi:hypothetical protein
MSGFRTAAWHITICGQMRNLRQFWHSEDRASWYILIIKPTRCTISQIYFWNRSIHVLDRFSVHHQESNTLYTAIGICWLLASGIRIYTVLDSWWWIENLSETCRVIFQKYIWETSSSHCFYCKTLRQCSRVCLTGWEENHKDLSRDDTFRAENWTSALLNAKQECTH